MRPFELSVHFFLQLAVILLICRLVGWRAGWRVDRGRVLGPSLFGLLLPEAQAWLFPRESMTILFAVSQVGLALYMSVVGLELRSDLFRGMMRGAATVSAAGMIAPFALGALLAFLLQDRLPLFAPGVSRGEAMLFLGAAMCITAFPMLARIVHERGLTGTSLGTLALAAGAIDDAAAWCVLAIVLASFGDDVRIAVDATGGSALYAALVLTIGRRLLAGLGRMTRPGRRRFAPVAGDDVDDRDAGVVVHRRDRHLRGLRRLRPGRRHAARRVRGPGARQARGAGDRLPAALVLHLPTRV